MSDPPRRFAVYAAPPPGSALADLAAVWLGRSATEPSAGPSTPVPGLADDRRARLTVDARRYGFHGTLKAPFRLAAGVADHELHRRVSALAAALGVVTVPRLSIDCLAGFAAFLPVEQPASLTELAATCVTELDDLRAPLTDDELAARAAAGLSPRHVELLRRWGYPYVLDEFRFHMTLTRRLDVHERDDVLAAARRWFADVDGRAFTIDRLCVFEQAGPDQPFVETARYPVGPGRRPVDR